MGANAETRRSDTVALLPAVREFCAKDLRCLVDGKFVAAGEGTTFQSIDPSNGRPIASVPRCSKADIDAAVKAARRAFDGGSWHKLGVMGRAVLLWKLADLVQENAAELAQLESLDTGKAIKEAESIDIPGAAQWFRYYSGAAPRIHGETFPMTVPGQWHSFTLREPVGVVGAIIPWNFPLVVASWKLAPALACGCTVVLKPPEETPLTCLRLAELAVEAGFPPGVINVVTGYGEEAGAPLSAHPMVDKVTFTGSTEVGRKIIEASKENFKRLTLELGGKSAHIVFADADIDSAAKVAARAGIFRNQGQICSAGSRVLAEASIYDRVVEQMTAHANAVRVGPGLSRETQMGPVISEAQYERVLGYIKTGREKDGAAVTTGGGPVAAYPDGYFIEPTVFAGVRNDMVVAQEEIFGPVVVIIPFADEEEAIAIANDTTYGLAAGVWTNDLKRAHRMVQSLRAGTVWVNTYNMIDVTTPWGGVGASGIGREHGQAALEHYTEIKTGVISLR